MPTKKKQKNAKGADNLKSSGTRRSRLYSVVIAGGSGTRFWPLSRQETPKQLLTIGSQKQTLIQSTISRINPLISFERTYIVTNPGQAEPINLQLLSMTGSSWDKQLIIEPEAKNTAPAIGLAALYLKQIDPEAIMVVLPSDHIIKKSRNFRNAVIQAAKISENGYLVTIGIKPDKPETGYGYIKRGIKIKQGAYTVSKFTEKPDKDKAVKYLKDGRYYWNSGIFVWRADAILKAMQKHMPSLHSGLMRIEKAFNSGKIKEITKSVFKELKPQSIDYGILEKVPGIGIQKQSKQQLFRQTSAGAMWEAGMRLTMCFLLILLIT